jgi:hypothetical protein
MKEDTRIQAGTLSSLLIASDSHFYIPPLLSQTNFSPSIRKHLLVTLKSSALWPVHYERALAQSDIRTVSYETASVDSNVLARRVPMKI